MKLLYFDTITHSPMALEYLVRNFGTDHVLLGSDYPHDMAIPSPLSSLRAIGIADEQVPQIASDNACKLLRIGI
jgi:aminocarboxymuconate-semialdehyde decarboxylase